MFKRAVFILAVVAIADSSYTIQFKNSQLITRFLKDKFDVSSNPISCPSPGCTVYSTIASSDVSINDGNTVLTTLDKIYKKEDGFLVGYHLPSGGNYTLEDHTPYTTQFSVFIAADSAGIGAVTAMDDPNHPSIVQPKGRRIVTFLIPSLSGVAFSAFKGTVAPKVYAVGFDSVGACRPVYTAQTVESASYTQTFVYNLATIDFGSTDASNEYSVAPAPIYNSVPVDGQSYNLMSNLYTGCDGNADIHIEPRYLRSMTAITIQAGDMITQAVVRVNDVYATSYDLQVCGIYQGETKQETNCFYVTGSQPNTYTFTGSLPQVVMRWSGIQGDDKEHYIALIEFSKGDWQKFGMFPILVALCAAFLST